MRGLVLGFAVLISAMGFGQDSEFKFTKNGITDYVIVNVDSTKTNSEIYKKALDWLQVTYKNPKEVLLGSIENEYIRFEAIKKEVLCVKSLGAKSCFDIKYQIEVTIKNGRYKFDVIKVEQFTSSTYVQGGWVELVIDGSNYSLYYKQSGELRQMFKLFPEGLENTFNSLNYSLRDYILGNKVNVKSEDW